MILQSVSFSVAEYAEKIQFFSLGAHPFPSITFHLVVSGMKRKKKITNSPVFVKLSPV